MLSSRSSVAAVMATLASVNALSTGCTTQIGSLALSGDLSQCLQLGGLLPVITSSGSLVDSINTYLGQLCASSTPTCSNSTLTSAQSSISSACATDLQAGGTDGTEVMALQQLLTHYDEVYSAGCAKNTTTNQYCVTSTLSQVQNDTGSDLSVSFLTETLSGQGNGTQQLAQAFTGGKLCTGCVQTIYQEAVKANSTIGQSSLASGLSQTCGSDFVNAASPSDVQVQSPSGAGGSASSSAANTSGAAGSTYTFPSIMPVVFSGTVMALAAVAGTSLVL